MRVRHVLTWCVVLGLVAGCAREAAPPDDSEEISGWFSRGAAVFNPPREMRQGTSAIVSLRIAVTPRDVSLTTPLEGGPATYRWDQDVSRVMTAKLSASGFDILPLTPEEQFIRGNHCDWRWRVVATTFGTQDLQLATGVVAEIKGLGQKQRAVHTEFRTVHVRVAPVYAVTKFTKKYWQWLLTTLVIPLVLWARRSLRKPQPAKTRRFLITRRLTFHSSSQGAVCWRGPEGPQNP